MNNTGNQEINPITRLDYPDPDVIRVDNTYYMVSTTCTLCLDVKFCGLTIW